VESVATLWSITQDTDLYQQGIENSFHNVSVVVGSVRRSRGTAVQSNVNCSYLIEIISMC